MIARNPHLAKLSGGYLFPEIAKRSQQLLKNSPDVDLISLSIGDTTQPLPPHITRGLLQAAEGMGTKEGYRGYGPAFGLPELREKIAQHFYSNLVGAEDVFISDGAKCDLGRLQVLFGSNTSVAVQDPAYPAYVDISVMMGQTQNYQKETDSYAGIVYMKCAKDNDFFPDLNQMPRTDLILFCSPNNPTGAVATHKQLQDLVAFAQKNKSILIFDTAYAPFIQDPSLPRSIYEIEGAKQVAIEVGSFSKLAGFTGLRLGWSVVPKELRFSDASSVQKDWARVQSTFFNSASYIIQKGALNILDKEGEKEVEGLIAYYLANAKLLKQTLLNKKIPVYGGDNAPYLWADFQPLKSWNVFDQVLQEAHILSSPGSGFGPAGEGFLRFSAFGSKERIEDAAERLAKLSLNN